MISVSPKPEPAHFNQQVRVPGNNYLKAHGMALADPLPPRADVPPYWRECLRDLYQAYERTCGYLAIRFEIVTGAASVDHFIPKSYLAGQAYEWSNYRLACLCMNTRKRDYQDVLDPFEIQEDWFRMDFLTGEVYENPGIDDEIKDRISHTIKRLRLDSQEINDLRLEYFTQYLDGEISEAYLKRNAPFVWKEANRQDLLIR